MIIIIFFLFLIGPNIIYLFVHEKLDHQNYENRQLYTKPQFSIQNISSFPSQYEKYFNDHLPFKNEIRKFRSSILYYLFGTSSNSRVIYGKNGWLFYNSKASENVDNIADFRKTTSFSNEFINKTKNNINLVNSTLKNKGIDFYILVLPNKESVYYDYMPDLINRNESQEKSRTDNLVEYLNENTDADIIYPKQALIDGKSIANTYFKYDTHWNNYGSYLGLLELMKIVEPTTNLEHNLNKDFYLQSGDLANMILLKNYLISEEPTINKFLNNISSSCNSQGELTVCTSNGLHDKTFLLVGDSFRHIMIQYLSKIYTKSIFIHRDSYDEDLIEKYNADVVVYESIERYSSSLKNVTMLAK